MDKRDRVSLDEKEIIRLYIEEKLTIEDIRKKFNVNYATIKLRLERNNIPLRSASESKKIVMNRKEVKKKVSVASKNSAEKRKKTNLERYGSVVPASSIQLRKRWEEEYIKEHGISYGKDPNRLRKIEETCLEKEGVVNVSQFKSSREKISTNRWKNKTKEELDDIINKSRATCIDRIGVPNPLEDEVIKEKVRKSRWVDKTKSELEEIENKGKRTIREKMLPVILGKLKEMNLKMVSEYKNTTEPMIIRCLKCNTEFETVLDYIFHDYGRCPVCFPKYISRWEQEVREFLEDELDSSISIQYNNRRVLKGNKELDIFVPDKNIAIECNGIYYHSEKMSSEPKTYHLDKTVECEKLGIRLVHIFEDEWIYKNEIVKQRLLNILGFSKAERVNARDCTIKEIETREKNNFLDKYHLQGKDSSVIKLGAFYHEELVSIMTFSKGNISKGSISEKEIWELNRFATNYHYNVRGIAGKLLSYFKKHYKWKEIFSYADRRWSDGGLYKTLGFSEMKVTEPSYWYVKGLKRIHRFSLRKRPHESKDITEWKLRGNEGYTRIWDCGHYKFSIKNSI